MNAIFAAVFLLSALLFLLRSPDGFLSALLSGGQKAAVLSLSLLSVYCVWLGFFKVLEKSGLSEKIAKLFYPPAKRLFRSNDRNALSLACGNLSANLLGLPGAPTPLGVRATQAFCSAENFFAAEMLFVLNATSLQLFPATVIALRLSAGSLRPADIFLPSLLCTLFSTALGALLLLLTSRRARSR